MQSKSASKKLLCIFTIFLMIFSINLSINASADPLKTNQGLYYDDFENDNNIVTSKCDYVPSMEYIVLNKSSEPYPFDFKNYPDNTELYYSESYFSGFLYQYINPNLAPGIEGDNKDIRNVGTIGDDLVFLTEVGPLMYYYDEVPYPMHHFKFEIPHDIEELNTITLNWYFGDYISDANLEEIVLYLWDYGTLIPKWKEQENVNYSASNIIEGEPSIQTVFNNDEFISSDGYIDVLVIGTPTGDKDGSILSTDYINLSICTDYGYVNEGTVTTKETIKPPNLGKWDRVFWEEDISSSKSSITIQILNNKDEVIEGFESTKSPLDISDLKNSEIKIRAILKSNSLTATPHLDEWGVLYQKKEGFFDDFTNNYRIYEMQGLKFDGDEIKLDNYYSNWPFYGKNSDNSRSYDGSPLIEEPDDYYWYSKVDMAGGGFRAPVIDNGKVYAASANDVIFAYSEVRPGDEKNVDPVDASNDSYKVDSTIAVSKDYVIFGTNKLNEKNYVYALDKNNLKNEVWSYCPSDGESLGFISAPTIHNDKVFICSCNGKNYELPFLSVFNSLFGGNHYLIALDQSNGDTIWDPFELPSGSLSSPAIGDEKVFVACQSMFDSNLFAVNIDTGEELWNVSVGSPYGVIGRSSPVYSDGKVFIMLNERSSIFSSGENKLYALNAKDGAVLWNKTIDTPKFSLIEMVRGIYSSSPISSPAYYNDCLYLLSQNGSLLSINPENGNTLWNYSFSNTSILSPEFCTSPLVINDYIYVIAGSDLYSFNTNQESTVEPEWKYKLKSTYDIELFPQGFYASPVYADGMIFVSGTKNFTDYNGRIYSIGSYRPNSKGYLESTIIQNPDGYWWSIFDTEKDLIDNNNNSILFKVLDSDGNILEGFDNLNGTNNNITKINNRKIKLFAEFEITNRSQSLPVLDSWSINWVEEKAAPEFNVTNINSWVNNELPSYLIDVQDNDDDGVLSGIDNSSGKYRLLYIPKDETEAIYSDWMNAYCAEPSGSKYATLTAEISKSNFEIKELINISFEVKDLAGNKANTSEISFQSDINDPSSRITDYSRQEDKTYLITAEAEDEGGSGVEKVTLKYRYKNSSTASWGELIEYSSDESYYNWNFGKNDQEEYLDSGYYQLVTIAKDKASNVEEFSEDNAINIVFDAIEPSIDSSFEDILTRDIPSVSIKISDDFMLNESYFLIDSLGYWEKIKDFSNETAEFKWVLPSEIWIDWEELEEHLIRFRVTDLADNEYVTDLSNSLWITKDENASKSYLDLSDFSELHLDDEFEIKAKNLQGIDIENVTLFYKYSEDKNNWSDEWTQFGETKSVQPFNWTFNSPDGNGFYKFYILLEDIQGEFYTSKKEIINIAVIPLSEILLFTLLLFVSIIVSIMTIKRIKKKKQDL